MVRRKIRDEDDARACLAAAEASGLPRAAWSRANGIDGRSLNAWRMNLERRGTPRSELRLVELVAAERREVPAATYGIRCGELVVEVDEHFDDDVLWRLLAVVTEC